MARTRLQPGQPELVQPSADRALVHFYGEPSGHLDLQVHASPAHNLVRGWIGSRDNQRFQLSHLCRAQSGRTAGAAMRLQAFDASRVVTMNPVTQRLPVHAALGRSLAARPPFQNQRQRQKPANLRPVRALARMISKVPGRVLRSRHPKSCTHPNPPSGKSCLAASNQKSRARGIPYKSQSQQGLVLDQIVESYWASLAHSSASTRATSR